MLLLSSCALVPLLDTAPSARGAPHLPFLLLAALFMVGGLLLFYVEFRSEAASFVLSEVPLVLGLFLVEPGTLIAARLVGEAAAQLAQLAQQRQPAMKAALNLAVGAAECVAALFVMEALGHPSAVRPIGWVAVLAAVLAADLVSNLTIFIVIRWHGGRPDLAIIALTAAMTAVCNSCLGILALLLLHVHVASMAVLGVLVGVVYLGYRGYTDLHQRYASLQLLHDFGQSTAGTVEPDEVAEAMLLYARQLLRTEMAELLLLPTDEPGVRMTARAGAPMLTTPLGVDVATFQTVLDADAPVVVRQGESRGLLDGYLQQTGTKDALLVALRLGGGARAIFAVAGRLANVSTLDEKDAQPFATLANQAAATLEKGRLIERLRDEARSREHQALHDSLTDLPNRSCFRERANVELAAAGTSRVAVLLLDLDQFKQVNDTLGHQTGDELLQEVARRLRAVTRDRDFPARLGGDEFAVMIGPTKESLDSIEAAARRIAEAVEAPVILRGMRLDVRVSIGIAVSPDHGHDADGLLQRADVAMYQAKASGESPQMYQPDVDENSIRRLQLAGDLRRAIDDGDLVVHYQPQADLADATVTGMEALCRWSHPEHGPVSPDEFIPVAEQTGLITPLTMCVLADALEQCDRWRRTGQEIGVAVNVSARSLLDAAFADSVIALVRARGIPPHLVTLEITESSIMTDTHRTLGVLRQLADSGLQLSVDDFGTGYSSLAYLQRLPVHELKVDRSFVLGLATSESNRAIVRSVIDLGHSLGLVVIAEGVEDDQTWAELRALGCDRVQGYFLGRPMPSTDALRWLQGTRASAPTTTAVSA